MRENRSNRREVGFMVLESMKAGHSSEENPWFRLVGFRWPGRFLR